ncbi:hypothetical protein MuYL_0554 [Mucilaginibacter xinganensis]|uniref:Uncharacterized protein n=1 Tax=Mucilaginibacter xinganensis TaxID=1234841 RepID=A0A223NRJ3_9SPHI|nr:hypothetical protein MuYL_0554 [Mucilaginibacter xinganensis]
MNKSAINVLKNIFARIQTYLKLNKDTFLVIPPMKYIYSFKPAFTVL